MEFPLGECTIFAVVRIYPIIPDGPGGDGSRTGEPYYSRMAAYNTAGSRPELKAYRELDITIDSAGVDIRHLEVCLINQGLVLENQTYTIMLLHTFKA